jgi:hypothetical protein
MFKTQTTLDGFFKNSASKKNDYQIKRYFYLIWENKFKPNLQAYWCIKKPEKVNFIEQIQCNYIKKGYYYYICGYFSDIDEQEYKLFKEKIYKNIPYLKSHLQKCIRKQDDILAIPTCYHLLKLDINELIRRLPIIMIEDTFLHESFTTLIWLMIAISTKKFKLKKYIYEWILGVVHLLCNIKEKDIISENINNKNTYSTNIELLDSYNDLLENEFSLLYSMHMRISYGGLDGDLKMINSFLNLWEERFRNKLKNINKQEIRPITLFIKELSIEEWDLSAIDFHCNSKFLEYIGKKYDNYSNDEIKKIVWYHSSSINYREKNSEYNIKAWNEIKDYVIKTQKYLLNTSY